MYKVKDNYLQDESSLNEIISLIKDSLVKNSDPKHNIFLLHVLEYAFSLISLRVQTKPKVKWLTNEDYDYFKLTFYLINLQNYLKKLKKDLSKNKNYIKTSY